MYVPFTGATNGFFFFNSLAGLCLDLSGIFSKENFGVYRINILFPALVNSN